MSFRFGAVLAIAMLVSGCCSAPSFIDIEVPVNAAPRGHTTEASVARREMPTTPVGLGDLVEAQLLASSGHPNEVIPLTVSRKQVKEDVEKMLKAARFHRHGETASIMGMSASGTSLFLIYFEAYFRNWRFLDLSGILKPEDTFFYNRAGSRFQFPAVTVKPSESGKRFEVTKVNEMDLIADLTRIAVEAKADARAGMKGVPAHRLATGCVKERFGDDCVAENADTKKFDCVMNIADKTEAVVALIVSQAIRGAWFGALNNEALAKAIEVGLSVGFRKGAEEWAAHHGCTDPKRGTASVLHTATIRVQLAD